MNNETEKIKYLKSETVKTFRLLFLPHLMVTIITLNIASNRMEVLKWHLCWFVTYFTIAFLVYVFAPKIINRQISQP